MQNCVQNQNQNPTCRLLSRQRANCLRFPCLPRSSYPPTALQSQQPPLLNPVGDAARALYILPGVYRLGGARALPGPSESGGGGDDTTNEAGGEGGGRRAMGVCKEVRHERKERCCALANHKGQLPPWNGRSDQWQAAPFCQTLCWVSGTGGCLEPEGGRKKKFLMKKNCGNANGIDSLLGLPVAGSGDPQRHLEIFAAACSVTDAALPVIQSWNRKEAMADCVTSTTTTTTLTHTRLFFRPL